MWSRSVFQLKSDGLIFFRVSAFAINVTDKYVEKITNRLLWSRILFYSVISCRIKNELFYKKIIDFLSLQYGKYWITYLNQIGFKRIKISIYQSTIWIPTEYNHKMSIQEYIKIDSDSIYPTTKDFIGRFPLPFQPVLENSSKLWMKTLP